MTGGGPSAEDRTLQAIVDAQEEERRRIARAVHDGPAQAMANVVLQSEISERSFAIDAQRARQELAALRESVNRTLQELRGLIFELRPTILDDLGLAPTLKRYAQTLVDKHAIQVEMSSQGRERRLPAEDELGVFRLVQDALVERIERAGAKSIAVVLEWGDDALQLVIESDGSELPGESPGASGVRRSQRVGLLRGSATQERGPGGTVVLKVSLPVPPAPVLIT